MAGLDGRPADCMLFNYRQILTSGSASLARSWGIPMALPARLTTVDLMEPCANVVRFADTPEAMLAAVRQAAAAGPMPAAAAHFRAATAWDEHRAPDGGGLPVAG